MLLFNKISQEKNLLLGIIMCHHKIVLAMAEVSIVRYVIRIKSLDREAIQNIKT